MNIKVIKLSLIPIFFENKTIGIAKAKAGTNLTTKIENKRTYFPLKSILAMGYAAYAPKITLKRETLKAMIKLLRKEPK